jgi:hypothetical protein
MCNQYDDHVCYLLIANLDLGGIVSLASKPTLRSSDRDWRDKSALSAAKSP